MKKYVFIVFCLMGVAHAQIEDAGPVPSIEGTHSYETDDPIRICS